MRAPPPAPRAPRERPQSVQRRDPRGTRQSRWLTRLTTATGRARGTAQDASSGTVVPMLTYLLATDPATAPGVLTYLASRDLLPSDALALAAHPNLPADAPLVVPEHDDDDLHTALADPRIPAGRRQGFIDSATYGGVIRNIADHDDLTPDELTRYYNAFSQTRGDALTEMLLVALARNTRTPAELAPDLVEGLRHAGRHLLADVTALRHHLAPTSDAAQEAAARPDPLDAYAHTLLPDTASRTTGWWNIIEIFPHPVLTAAALTDAAAATNPLLTSSICRAIAAAPRATPEHRYRAAALTPHLLPLIEDTAPEQVLADLNAHANRACGWRNAHLTDTALAAIYHRAQADSGPYFVLGALALHPGASPALRRDVTTTLTALFPDLAALTAQLTGAGPGGALDLPYCDLLNAEDITEHTYPWARAAWAHHHRGAPVTLDYTHALLTLEAGEFPGTLRELLETAHRIAT